MTIPPEKEGLLNAAEQKVDIITDFYRKGLLSDEERSQRVVSVWDECTKDVATALQKNLDKYNPINMMAVSGARGSIKQIRQLAGMRGLIANTSGKVIEVPIRANYREGLNVQEYFISSRGARKGLADTALRTADSGYLTRRLVDVAQDVIVREDDCGTEEGLTVFDIKDGNHILEPLAERLEGRYLFEDAIHPETGELLWSKEDIVTADAAKKIVNTVGFKEFLDRMENQTGFEDIDGIGGEKSNSILQWYAEENNQIVLKNLLEVIRVKEVEKQNTENGRCNGQTFVITGDVHHFKNRDEFKAYVEAEGGKVAGSVSGKTNYLVNNDVESTSSKNKKAKSLGVPIISEDTFIEMFGGKNAD